MQLRFDNAFLRELPGDPVVGGGIRQVEGALWSAVGPTPVAAPRLLAHSREMAARLGFSEADIGDPAFAEVFAGNALLPGMQPWAANYGGHQFGHWAGQLGDGRAISLGEAVNAAGERWELQLKGAGPTPYSRGADGRAVLRSSIREFVCSEAMHHLGVPTTRALSLVATGETVVRDMFYDGHPAPEPGAIVCRAAPSFIRFGSFELPAARGDVALLRRLADFCIARDFPWLGDVPAGAERDAAWFTEVCERTARLVAHWMRVGFVHGVLNTDNMSILGLTIDYGPYGWIDDFDPDWTPNTTDAQGRRYRFGWQPRVARWNLACLAQALAPLFDDLAPLQAGLAAYDARYAACEREDAARKLGLREADDAGVALLRGLQDWMQAHEVDMTIAFRALCALDPAAPDPRLLRAAYYDPVRGEAGESVLEDWLARYAARLQDEAWPVGERLACMHAANPRVVPRNYLAQQAIDCATRGDLDGVRELLEAVRQPYDEVPGQAGFAARRPDWARDKPGCSMLSCSS